MKYIFLICGLLVLLLSGCVSVGNQKVEKTTFILSRDISWTAKPLGFEETIFFAAGEYTLIRRDTDGSYLLSATGKFIVQAKGRAPVSIAGGVYLPDNPAKGINIFVITAGAFLRKREWGPSELVSHFIRVSPTDEPKG
jgi:hypothetical protein